VAARARTPRFPAVRCLWLNASAHMHNQANYKRDQE
jgi:hypothetical protein